MNARETVPRRFAASLKEAVYAAAKTGGGFRLSRYLTSRKLCILGYHGFSLRDEHLWRPLLFHGPELFARRLAYLKRAGYRTVPLQDAVRRLRDGSPTGKDIVITIDDGFYSVAALAAPLLLEFGFTATIFVTTYYVKYSHPIFRLAIQYMFWKTPRGHFETADLLPGPSRRVPTKGDAGKVFLWQLIGYGETRLGESERMALARAVAERLDIDYAEIVASRRLSLMTPEEIAQLARQGFDIQLHTHRHYISADANVVERELTENRRVLEPLAGRPLNHLCYPSGIWSPEVWPYLAANGVETAVTCDPGLNSPSTAPLALHRFLDGDSVPQIAFEAEVSGFASLLKPSRRERTPVSGRPEQGRLADPGW
jgi:peptidoglycan/xylan/chitin deacetylase (PgdA/CDA1 family)